MTEPKKTSCLQKCPSNDIELVLLSGKTHSDTQTSQGDTSNDSKFLQNPDDTTPLKDIRAKRLRQTSTHDGVFSNMAARPELMVLPKPSTDLPPVPQIFLERLLIVSHMMEIMIMNLALWAQESR